MKRAKSQIVTSFLINGSKLLNKADETSKINQTGSVFVVDLTTHNIVSIISFKKERKLIQLYSLFVRL